MWRKRNRFQMPGRAAAIAWVLVAAVAIGIDALLIAGEDRPVTWADILILAAVFLGTGAVVLFFNYYIFRTSFPHSDEQSKNTKDR